MANDRIRSGPKPRLQPEVPFRVFHRVDAPGITPNELWVPQQHDHGWKALERHPNGDMRGYATEAEAQQVLIAHVELHQAKIQQRIMLLTHDLMKLNSAHQHLKFNSIAINARNVQ